MPIQGVLFDNARATIFSMRDGHFCTYWVYIMASRTGTLYIGVTGDPNSRIRQYKAGEIEGFTKTYGCDRLVYYETSDDIGKAISREKQLKGWRREKKIALIEKTGIRTGKTSPRVSAAKCCFRDSPSRELPESVWQGMHRRDPSTSALLVPHSACAQDDIC